MKNQRFFVRRLFQPPVLIAAGLPVFVFMLTVLFHSREAASILIPPEVEKKAVELQKNYADDEQFFREMCVKCHQLPDPVKSISAKPACEGTFSRDDLARTVNYMATVQAGKRLYEGNCGRCHDLIDPGLYTFGFWSKNICTSDSCMVKRRLTGDEEQLLLLYLSSHSKKENKRP